MSPCVDGIPSTEGDAAAHLFRTVVFDSDFEANFDVVIGGVTAITVIVFEPPAPTATEPAAPTATQPTAPTATATATTPADDDDGAAPTATGTVSTLPSTGAGDDIGAAGGAAWLLIGALGLIAIASAGLALRRRVA